MHLANDARRKSLHEFVSIFGWVAWTYLLLRPILMAPLLADDFLAPFTEYRAVKGNPETAISNAMEIIRGGVSFRPLSTFLTSLQNYATIELGLRFSISPTTVFTVFRFCSYLLLIDAMARLLLVSKNQSGMKLKPGRDLVVARILSTTLLASLIQVHFLWSNDPVTNYFFSGVVPVSVMLHFLRFAIASLYKFETRDAIKASLVGLLAAGMYELTIGIALGFVATAFVLMVVRKRLGNTPVNFWCFLIPLPNIAFVLIGRLIYQSKAGAYGGTTIGNSGSIVRTALIHLGGNIPATGWDLSTEVYPSAARTDIALLLLVATVGVVVHWGLKHLQLGTLRLILPVLFMGMVVPVALLSVTDKVQAETTRVGQVYIPYMYGLPFVVFLLICLLNLTYKHAQTRTFARFLFIAFATVQISTNRNLSEFGQTAYRANSELLTAWAESEPRELRCARLANWTSIPWPTYYRDELIEGLTLSYRAYHRSEFC